MGEIESGTQIPEHLTQVDLLKGLAIISVIIIHVWQPNVYLYVLAPYYLWQAVPVLVLLAGFTGAYAYRRYGATSLRQCYDLSILSRRLNRLVKPYIFYWAAQITILILLFQFDPSLTNLLTNFILGGSGWGSYFVPVILQGIIIIPVLYLLALRDPDLMLVLAFCISLSADLVLTAFGVNQTIISILYFRYMFAGALGVRLALPTKLQPSWLVLSGLLGLLYITAVCYTPVFNLFPEFTGYNGLLHAPVYVWTFLLVLVGIAWLPGTATTRVYRYLEKVGKASWHIFLAQMFYFLFLNPLFIKYILSPLESMVPLTNPSIVSFLVLVPVFDVIVCCLIGYIWYAFGNNLYILQPL